MGGKEKPAFSYLNAGCLSAPGSGTLDQPVKRGVTSFLAQRWNDSRSFFGLVPVPFRKVTETTKRWTPIRILAGLILTA